MTASAALACKAALSEMDRLHPARSRAADGILGDLAHQARISDHNDGNAFDVTHDPSQGVDTYLLADELRKRCKAGIERRVKYIISHGRIASEIDGWAWRRYEGANQHDHHMHVSIQTAARNDIRSWWPQVTAHAQVPPTPIGDDDVTADEVRQVVQEEFAKLYGEPVDKDKTHVSMADINGKLNKILTKLGVQP